MEAKRKKWTAKENLTATEIKFNEKRKWQLALRRYVIEKKLNYQYAPYFGLDIERFRNWIEIQFSDDLNWDNFAIKWQFDHIVPVNYFDFDNEEDLKLCWSFVNLQVEKLDKNKDTNTEIDIFSAKAHFEKLYAITNYTILKKMLLKIAQLESSGLANKEVLGSFLKEENGNIVALQNLSVEDFARINGGETLSDIIKEQEIMKRFG